MWRRRGNQEIEDKKPTKALKKHETRQETTKQQQDQRNQGTCTKEQGTQSQRSYYRPKPQALQARTQNYTKKPQEHKYKKKKRSISFFFLCS